MANRVTEVNTTLRELGMPERLARGKGYYYFRHGNALSWSSSSVYVFRADALTVREWLNEYFRLKGNRS